MLKKSLIILILLISCNPVDPTWDDSFYGRWEYINDSEFAVAGFLALYPDSTFSSTFSYWFTFDTSKIDDTLFGIWRPTDLGGPHDPSPGLYFKLDSSHAFYNKGYSTISSYYCHKPDSTDTLKMRLDGGNERPLFKFKLIERFEP